MVRTVVFLGDGCADDVHCEHVSVRATYFHGRVHIHLLEALG